jgi:hypothetical protein
MDIFLLPDEVINALAGSYDFHIKHRPNGPLYFSVSPATDLIPLAGDAAGGVYAQLKDRGDILYVNSEGSGAIIAPDLQSLMLLLVCHPYWQDLLKFSNHGSLSEMQRTLPFAHSEYFLEAPETLKLGHMIRKRLNLPPVTDVVDALHTSVANSPERLTILSPDGYKYGSLFGRFTSEQHTGYKRAKREGRL